jgi:mannosyl-oligosaccharide glucosidase
LKTDIHDSLFTRAFVQRLESWYQWYNRTQTGSQAFSFRWRGRNESSMVELNPKTLTSGLDDYPRASHPTDIERHLDLRCWMALASSVLGKLHSMIDRRTTNKYLDYARLLADNDRLDRLHWSDEDGMYADYGLHTDHVHLKRVPMSASSSAQHSTLTHMIRQVNDHNDLRLRYVQHFGYISLFPLMTRLLDVRSSKLGKILVDLRNSTLLWTPYGLRSLARTSTLYDTRNTEHDPPYWRGMK